MAASDRIYRERALMDASKQTKNQRLILLLIIGVPVAIIIAASWLWMSVDRGDVDLVSVLGTSNNGRLLQPPRSLDELSASRDDGTPFSYSESVPQWTFVIPGGSHCQNDCEQLLYLTRQIHQAMGKYLNRIRRMYVSTVGATETAFDLAALSDDRPAPADFQQYLESEQRGMEAMVLSADDFGIAFPEFLDNPATWYLVDPQGWIMMSYNSEVPHKDVMADLKFLLKNSSD
jgi:cytochrome oxidase Cu insertion factor (SCO1/SenC/PrrC family)